MDFTLTDEQTAVADLAARILSEQATPERVRDIETDPAGSETGWVGVAFLCLTTVAGLLWASRGTAKYAVVAAAGWTALLLHSLIDHLLEFPPVVIAAGLVLGWADTTPPEASSQRSWCS